MRVVRWYGGTSSAVGHPVSARDGCSVQDSRCATAQEPHRNRPILQITYRIGAHGGVAAERASGGRSPAVFCIRYSAVLRTEYPPISLRSSQRQLAVGSWTPLGIGARKGPRPHSDPRQAKENTACLLSACRGMLSLLVQSSHHQSSGSLARSMPSDEAGRIRQKHPFPLVFCNENVNVCGPVAPRG